MEFILPDYLGLVNFILLICLYSGLVVPNTDFTHFFTSSCISYKPVITWYRILLRAMRALLNTVVVLTTAVLVFFIVVNNVFNYSNFKSVSFGVYKCSLVKRVMSLLKFSVRLSKLI